LPHLSRRNRKKRKKNVKNRRREMGLTVERHAKGNERAER
jgi:hypothetical protein